MTKLISPDTLKTQLETEAPTIIDVRSPEEYAEGHVPGAVNIPMDELEQRLDEVPQDRPVVPYCNMYHPGSSRGERAAMLFQAHGYEANTLEGGFPAWMNLGRDVTEEEKR